MSLLILEALVVALLNMDALAVPLITKLIVIEVLVGPMHAHYSGSGCTTHQSAAHRRQEGCATAHHIGAIVPIIIQPLILEVLVIPLPMIENPVALLVGEPVIVDGLAVPPLILEALVVELLSIEAPVCCSSECRSS